MEANNTNNLTTQPSAGLENSPFIPNEVYSKLPQLLQKACNILSDKREKDILLTSLLGVMSGCIPEIEGIYSGQSVYPCIYTFIVAPPASGKGVMGFARTLADHYHRILYNSKGQGLTLKKERDKQEETDTTNTPHFEKVWTAPKPLLFIPGNVSAAGFIELLTNCNGEGIMFEAEADTLTNSLKQDWGGFSDLLRKAYQHETISSYRKTKTEYTEVKNPKLAVVLSGTPSQVPGLIKSVHDGLFSRFIFYTFQSHPTWNDVSQKGKETNLTEYYEKLSEEVTHFIKHTQMHPFTYRLSQTQFDILNSEFDKILKRITITKGAVMEGTIKRMGLNLFRISMVLTALRRFDEQNQEEIIECSEDDFRIALLLTKTYLEHAILILTQLPKHRKSSPNGLQLLFEKLPKDFLRKDAQTIGKSFNFCARKTDGFLADMVDAGLLVKCLNPGQYSKV